MPHMPSIAIHERLRRLALPVVASAALALAGCGGSTGSEEEGGDPPTASITISPDPATVARTSALVIRVDLKGANNEAPTAYEIDLDEVQSKISITTAPCPSELGRPACQDWTIVPATDAVPGDYPVNLRSVGLATGLARGEFLLRVIDELPRHYGPATAVAAGRDFAVVIASGQIYAQGDNSFGQLGSGYLQSAFSRSTPLGLEKPRPMPASAATFEPVPRLAPFGAQVVSIAATNEAAFAVDEMRDVFHWGYRRWSLGGTGPAGDDQPYQLRTTEVPDDNPIVAVAASNLGAIARTDGGGLLLWGDGFKQPFPISLTDMDDRRLEGVRAVADHDAILMEDGGVREVFVAPRTRLRSGTPAGIAMLAVGYLPNDDFDGRRTVAAVTASGALYTWKPEVYGSEPQLETEFSDYTAVAFHPLSYLLLLRAGDPGLWVFQNGSMRSVAPPPGRRFARVFHGWAIDDTCGRFGGALYRIDIRGDADGTLEAVRIPGFGAGPGSPCPGDVPSAEVTLSVEGSGRVLADPALLDCGSRCTAPFELGTDVVLHPVPAPGWRFASFDSRCDGRSLGHADLGGAYALRRLAAAAQCRMVFERELPTESRLTVVNSGGGSVTSDPAGIVCGTSCSYWFPTGASVRLEAVPARGWRFEGFSGDPACAASNANDNTLSVREPLSCEARFVALPAPGAPTDLRVDLATGTSVVLAWGAASGLVDGYRLERSTSGGPFLGIARLRPDETMTTDSPLNPGTTYAYRLAAYGPHASGEAATLTVTTPGGEPPPPPPTTPSSGWQAIGIPLANGSAPALALDAAQLPVVAFLERDAGGVDRLLVRRMTGGGAWADLGSLNPAPALRAAEPSIALDAGGRIVVAWIQSVPDGQHVQVARHDGSAWQRLCDEPSTCALNVGLARPAQRPSLALAGGGDPGVAWIEDGQVTVKRYGGNTWSLLAAGRGPVAAGIAVRARLAFDAADVPHVAWVTDSARDFVGVARAVGTSWQHLGSTLMGDQPAEDTTVRDLGLAISAGGTPWVAWAQGGVPGARAYARRWTGTDWAALGDAAVASGAPYEGFAFALAADGTPYVALSTFSLAGVGRLDIVRWLGSAWGAVGGFDARISSPSMKLPTQGATSSPHLAWQRDGQVQTWRWLP